jgi:4-amino-4-deoxy-L-arabinose transferase-like glycosyltransferase
LGALYAVLTPPWQVPDEPAHYNYVRYLVEQRRLPILRMGDYDESYLNEIKAAQFDPEYSIDAIRYEFHQPPLYYLVLAPFYALFGGALIPLRLLSLLLGAGVLVVAYRIGKATFPDSAWPALGTTAFTAFIPQHIAMTAAVENDVLAELILGIVLLGLIRWVRSERTYSVKKLAFIGVIIGLGLLTKISAYVTVPLAAIAVGLRFWRATPTGHRRFDVRSASIAAVALLLPALLLSLPWFVRNAAVYGDLDITGKKWHDLVVVGQLRTSQWIAEHGWVNLPGTFLRTTIHSFWAQFGWMAVPIDGRIYSVLGLLSVLASLGCFFRLLDAWEDKHKPTATGILLACSGALTLAGYLWYNLGFYQAQGRYLFPALIPLGLMWTLGLKEVLRPRNAPLVGIALALATVVGGIRLLTRTYGSKWRVLINGLGTAFAWGGWLLPSRLGNWLLAAPYLFLAVLCAVSPFWFIIPYLTPGK